MRKKIVNFLFPKYPDPEIEKKIDLDNLKFVRMMSVCVMILESLMLLRYGVFGNRASQWYEVRIGCYIIFFALSAACFLLTKYVLRSVVSHRLLMIIGLNYCAAAIVWGMVVSAIDYTNGEQMLVFVTIVVCVAGLAFIKPSVSIPLFTAAFAVFYGILVLFCDMDATIPTNYFILLIMIILTSITRYHFKLSDTTARVEHEKLNAQLQKLSLYDELTQVKNRRSLSIDARGFLSQPLLLMLIDIDNFKDINDTFGHDHGDRLLKQVARHLQEHFSTQKVYRYGGDEFIIAESNGDPETFLSRFKRFQADIADLPEQEPCPKITVSGGYILGTPKDMESFNAMISRADKALYLAKRNGKNQIRCAG